MLNLLDPDYLSPDERHTEIAMLLARGFLRARGIAVGPAKKELAVSSHSSDVMSRTPVRRRET